MNRSLPSRLADVIFGRLRATRRTAIAKGRIAYYPVFRAEADLTNHYHRACWYLPSVPGKISGVTMHQDYSGDPRPVGPRPDYMATDGGAGGHIEIRNAGRFAAIRSLWSAHVILVWRNPRLMPVIWVMRLLGATVLNVTTDDVTAREYGNYCKIAWAYLTSRQERDAILAEDRRRFMEYAGRVRARGAGQACAMGNGPTLEHAFAFDFSNTLSIVCNSTVGDDRIMRHVKPAFVAACDVVSHMGVSAQSGDFRRMLIRAMAEYDFMFVTTATFGYLTTLHYPAYRDRILLIEQTSEGPVYDWIAQYAAPMLDSVMNIVMLPLSATFCDDIWLLGADGKSTARSNEDFWAHAVTAGTNQQLVQAGHTCHPVFDIHRQQATYDRYNESIEHTVLLGERAHGKRYRCLFASNTPVLAPRAIPAEWRAHCTSDSPCNLDGLTARARAEGKAPAGAAAVTHGAPNA